MFTGFCRYLKQAVGVLFALKRRFVQALTYLNTVGNLLVFKAPHVKAPSCTRSWSCTLVLLCVCWMLSLSSSVGQLSPNLNTPIWLSVLYIRGTMFL